MYGGFQNHGHHGHGHHGHHHGHHKDNQGFGNQGFNQQMSWAPIQGQQYRIVSGLSSKMVLDVSQSQHDHNHLIIYESNNGANQRFYFQSIGGNKYGIFSAKTHQTVEVPQGSSQNGTRIVCSQANKQVNEFWELIPANFMGKQNAFYIKSFCGKALDVKGGECHNEAHVIQWDYNGGNNQIWVIEQC